MKHFHENPYLVDKKKYIPSLDLDNLLLFLAEVYLKLL